MIADNLFGVADRIAKMAIRWRGVEPLLTMTSDADPPPERPADNVMRTPMAISPSQSKLSPATHRCGAIPSI
ncbi:hypothetical protein CCGE531_28410 (plasmid) [Rhizobium sp. CCGE531]|nr:hypothetical protein CCGE531_28410 [Rhizobium sp. CCGE531]AYG76368.1 hypothetical protein CCGE532_27885 [Rhizobium sp. CCGE532]